MPRTTPRRPEPAAIRNVPAAWLDRRSPVPLFVQITRKLRESLQADLQSGRLKPGDFFATEKALCEQFGVSIITAKRVLDDLESEGVVVRLQGRGTYVAHSRVQQVVDHFYRFTTEMQKQGLQPAWKNLEMSVVMADAKIAKALNLSAGDEVIRLERLRLLNDEPYFLHHSWLPLKLFPGFEDQPHDTVPLYDILGAKYNRAPVRCRDTFEPTLVPRRAARLLRVPARSAGMLVERIAWDAQATPVELSHGIVRGDRWRLSAELK